MKNYSRTNVSCHLFHAGEHVSNFYTVGRNAFNLIIISIVFSSILLLRCERMVDDGLLWRGFAMEQLVRLSCEEMREFCYNLLTPWLAGGIELLAMWLLFISILTKNWIEGCLLSFVADFFSILLNEKKNYNKKIKMQIPSWKILSTGCKSKM